MTPNCRYENRFPWIMYVKTTGLQYFTFTLFLEMQDLVIVFSPTSQDDLKIKQGKI